MLRRARAGIVGVLLAAGAGCGDEAGVDRAETESQDSLLQLAALDSGLARHLPAGISFEVAQQGQAHFLVCSVCHGPDARGTQLGPSLRDDQWIHGSGELAEITEVIRSGVAEPREFPIPMPPMGGGEFNDEELRALAAYVYLLGRAGE